MRKRKRQAVKKLIQCAAVIAAGVLAIILFMLAIWYRGKNSEPVTDEQVAAQMQQAEPLVIETPSYYEDVVSGKKGFELRKNDRGYKQGDSLKMLEFKDGKHTGRTIDADIIYMLEDYTGLTEGYCILGIRVTDYTGKVSETDTESGAEHE